MKAGDLVYKRSKKYGTPGLIVKITDWAFLDKLGEGIAHVYWADQGATFMYYFHKLEVISESR